MIEDTITITCRNEQGIDEDKTFCIDYHGFGRIINICRGSKISYDKDKLKIGFCEIPIISHNVFGGSWCAEDFYIERRHLIKLFKYLKGTGNWELEAEHTTFEYWWKNKI